MVGCYRDSDLRVFYGWAFAVKAEDGRTHLFYQGTPVGDYPVEAMAYLAAVSDDGIHFEPRNTAAEAGIENPLKANDALPLSKNYSSEIATILVDKFAIPEERYKILFTDNTNLWNNDCNWRIEDYILVSPDLIHWKKKFGSCWNPYGTEPVTGAFYNPVSGKFTILSRQHWGLRRVGYTETSDWRYYTPLELCMQCDSLDAPLAEIYGMPAMEYDNWFIGFPHIFSNHSLPHVRHAKSCPGTMNCELAYSLNGHCWQRSLRTPFIPFDHPDVVKTLGQPAGMIWTLSAIRQDDGSVLLYCPLNRKEHGTDKGSTPDDQAIGIFKVRPDGFIGLETESPDKEARLATRSFIWQGGKMELNLTAKAATCALYTEDGEKVLAGFDHADCQVFSGDEVKWSPKWQGGTLDEYIGRELVLELKLTDGIVYSITYDGLPLQGSDIWRFYGRNGEKPDIRPGF